ncbi:hypothetical protein Taro_006746 [Colocasia esculenta]|uniref:DDE Tnp4 domain-containing protein n=1 Tax=Colocasia esculenta TaxID=4460 RepID=A0A843TW75_COLES|nr:hypothetical protein [Colocasia esculenta]
MLISSTMDEDEEDTTPIPRPMHTSRYNTFRMQPSMFLKLRDILVERELIQDSRYVTASEQLAMFLYAMGHGVATGAMCEHFQHLSETISYYVNRVIKVIALFRFTYIMLPSGTDPVHPRIRHDDRFYPYVKDAIGMYYLVDSGYGNAGHFLAPYHGERYHISEYQNRGNAPYKNMCDKFDHRHAQLCNCMERCFGVLKNRFQTLREGNCYPFRVQVLIVLACCVVHNFIRCEHGEDYYFNLRQMDNVEKDDDPPDDPSLAVSPPEMQAGEILRTQINTQIWANN